MGPVRAHRVYVHLDICHMSYIWIHIQVCLIYPNTHIFNSHVSKLSPTAFLRGEKRFVIAALLEPKSGSQTVRLQLREPPWASPCLACSRNARGAFLSHGGSRRPRLSSLHLHAHTAPRPQDLHHPSIHPPTHLSIHLTPLSECHVCLHPRPLVPPGVFSALLYSVPSFSSPFLSHGPFFLGEIP